MWPWLDRKGRLSLLKLLVFVALFAPAVWIVVAFGTGAIGARALNAAIREFGLWTIRWLFLALAITPLCGIFAYPSLFSARRMIGVAAFAYGFVHLCFYTADQAFDLSAVAAEIVSRTYLTIGFTALVGLSALASTSTDGMVRRLGGRNWRRLHRFVYAIAVLGLVHFFLQSKLDVWEPTVMAGLLAWLLGYRVLKWALPRREGMSVAWVAGLGVAAALFTALAEALYFRLAMGADPLRVLAVNLGLAAGLRPAIVVLSTTLALTAAVAIRNLVARRGSGRSQFVRVRPSGVRVG
ncbi:MAG TPA: protein-methionine-sulfoxide reductase heme-binding subunit MsrQ [Stellaceae bacterium]|nr:protein-methionine-sulfoxide reductase heme-binding subunit MsrQ [Stellaceae bacterium]